MKKIALLATTVISLAATPGFAVASNSMQPTPLSGFYVGGYGGYDWSTLDANGVGDIDINGWDAGVFAGYKLDTFMKSMNGFGLGMNGAIEAFYGWSNSDDIFAGADIEKDNEWGVSFRPGFSAVDNYTKGMGVNPYFILGYRNTKFEGTFASIVSSERYNGFDLGIGTELIAWGDIGLRLEYTHTWYKEENNIDPHANDLRMGLSYHF